MGHEGDVFAQACAEYHAERDRKGGPQRIQNDTEMTRGDRVYSNLHNRYGTIARIDDAGFWFRDDRGPPDHNTLHYEHHLTKVARGIGYVPTPKPNGYGERQAPVAISATPFVWRDPLTIPPRPWVYGHHMMRKQVSVTVAPGGVGKSSLTLVEALAMVTGRRLLGEWVPSEPSRVWVYNLEDPRDEMERRVTAAMMHHDIAPDDLGGRLYIDTGRERPLCTATEVQGQVTIVRPEVEALAAEITARRIDVLIIDPFISSHRVSENASGAIDLVAKEWARLADRCNCAIELVHHTRKTNGAEATSEDGRGSSALLAAARSGRVLNKMDNDTKREAGVAGDLATYFAVTRDKANLAPAGKRQWVRMASVPLGQGDNVGVAEPWEWPDAFDGMKADHLLKVQQAIGAACEAGNPPRYSDQAGDDWAGVFVASAIGLDATKDKRRIKAMIKTWLGSKALVKGTKQGPIRKPVPTVEVGIWATDMTCVTTSESSDAEVAQGDANHRPNMCVTTTTTTPYGGRGGGGDAHVARGGDAKRTPAKRRNDPMIITRTPLVTGLSVALGHLCDYMSLPADDATITSLALAAAGAAVLELENLAGVALLAQAVTVSFDEWPSGATLHLPIAPMLSVAGLSMTADGAAFIGWQAVIGLRPALVLTGAAPVGRIGVSYTAGWPDPGAIPRDLQLAVMDQALVHFDAPGIGKAKGTGLSPHMARVAARYKQVRL